MGTTVQKLLKVLTSKNAIKTAIKNKTGVDPGNKMSTYASKINNLTIKTDAPMRLSGNAGHFPGNYIQWEAYPIGTVSADLSEAFMNDECISYLNLDTYLNGVKPTHINSMFESSYIESFDFGDVDLSLITGSEFENMFYYSGLLEVNFITNENKPPTDANYKLMFSYTGLESFSIENLDFGDANLQYFLSDNRSLTTVNFKNVTFGINLEYSPTLEGMFSGCSSLTSVNFDNVHIYNANATGMFSDCSALTTLDFSKCYFHGGPGSEILINNMFSSCTKLNSLTILDDLNNFTYKNPPFDGIKTTGTFYYDPYWYTDDSPVGATEFYQSLPSSWKKVALDYTITKNKSLTITPVADQVINQFTTTVDIVYQLNTDGTISSRVITDRVISGAAQASCTKNTTGKDRNITLSYTKNGLTAKTTVVQKYLTPTFNLSGSSWKTSTSTLVTGTYKYECYGGGEDADGTDEAMYVTIPAGINSIQFNCYSDTEGADYMYIEDNTYGSGEIFSVSGEDYRDSIVISFEDLFTDWDKTQPIELCIRYLKDSSMTLGTDKVYFGLTLLS